MTTETDICNLALDLLKEAPITSLEQDRPVARWCARNYPVQRDALLKRHDWNFAIGRVILSEDATAPAFGWARAFTLPSDCLRLIPLTADGGPESALVAHEIEDGRCLTDAEAPLKARYVRRLTVCDRYSPEFVEALSARLAMRMAHWLTGKTGYQQVAQGIFEAAIRDAWALDAIEGTTPRGDDNEWINAR